MKNSQILILTKILFLVSAFAGNVFASSSSNGANLVKNASFEKGDANSIADWNGSGEGIGRSSKFYIKGKHAYEYTGDGIKPLSQTIQIEKNTDYEISFWVKIRPISKGSAVFDTNDRFDKKCQIVTTTNQARTWVLKKASFNSGKHTDVTLRLFSSENFKGMIHWDEIVLKKK